MSQLLISVRSEDEAAAALAGGADLIDIKEPTRGSLGRADDAVIAAVVRLVAGRKPVSAAMGELVEDKPPYPGPGLSFCKWGLAGCGRRPDWPALLQISRGNSQAVFVAYADWQCAQAPSVADVVSQACLRAGSVLLVDTHCKDPGTLKKDVRPTLLDWLSPGYLITLCGRCHTAGVRVALAGSLGADEIKQLWSANPTWFAVRGAACEGKRRDGEIHVDRVRDLVDLLAYGERPKQAAWATSRPV